MKWKIFTLVLIMGLVWVFLMQNDSQMPAILSTAPAPDVNNRVPAATKEDQMTVEKMEPGQVKLENPTEVSDEIQKLYEEDLKNPNPKKLLLAQNRLLFDHIMGKNHPKKEVVLKLIGENFDRMKKIEDSVFETATVGQQLVQKLKTNFEIYRNEMAKALSDAEYKQFLGLNKEKSFGEALGLPVYEKSLSVLKSHPLISENQSKLKKNGEKGIQNLDKKKFNEDLTRLSSQGASQEEIENSTEYLIQNSYENLRLVD